MTAAPTGKGHRWGGPVRKGRLKEAHARRFLFRCPMCARLLPSTQQNEKWRIRVGFCLSHSWSCNSDMHWTVFGHKGKHVAQLRRDRDKECHVHDVIRRRRAWPEVAREIVKPAAIMNRVWTSRQWPKHEVVAVSGTRTRSVNLFR